MSRIPVVATPIRLSDLAAAGAALFRRGKARDHFEALLRESCGQPFVLTANSATTCLWLAFRELRTVNFRRQVILPAYTAAPVLIAVQQAGLEPVLCDITPGDYDYDPVQLEALVDDQTLCVVGVHLFGLVCSRALKAKDRDPQVVFFEDCCQAQGTLMEGRPVGGFGDISAFSFNRGKNIPGLNGGALGLSDRRLFEALNGARQNLPSGGRGDQLLKWIKLCLLAAVIRPGVYGIVHGLLRQYRERPVSGRIDPGKWTDFQAALAGRLSVRLEEFSRRRYDNGMRLYEALKDDDRLILPRVRTQDRPAFNRFPILFRDTRHRDRVQHALSDRGIEASRMYRALHREYPSHFPSARFPGADFCAEHLLTFPVHPLVSEQALEGMVQLINE